MNELPWFALSPSPFSIVFYLFLVVWGSKQLLERNDYRRWKYLNAVTDSVFIIGLVVLIGDLFWVVACALRFGQFFPESMMQLVFSAGRNIAGIVLCYLLIGNYFKNGVISFKLSTIALLLLNCIFLTLWFGFAPSPAYTDWTYAIKYGYSIGVVVFSFFISHIIGKFLIGMVYYSIWRKVE